MEVPIVIEKTNGKKCLIVMSQLWCKRRMGNIAWYWCPDCDRKDEWRKSAWYWYWLIIEAHSTDKLLSVRWHPEQRRIHASRQNSTPRQKHFSGTYITWTLVHSFECLIHSFGSMSELWFVHSNIWFNESTLVSLIWIFGSMSQIWFAHSSIWFNFRLIFIDWSLRENGKCSLIWVKLPWTRKDYSSNIFFIYYFHRLINQRKW